MRLVRYVDGNFVKPGILDADGRVRSLWPLVTDFDRESLDPTFLEMLATVDVVRLPLAPKGALLQCPNADIRQIIAVAVNYSDHAAERGNTVPGEPIVFQKSISSLTGPYDDIILPDESDQNDWELELGILIGSTARRVSESEAANHIAGLCVVNDVTERHWQHGRAGQFGKGKSFDTFTPVGPWLVTLDELQDIQSLDMWLTQNGQMRQKASTAEMVFGVARLVSYISEFMTLEAGDLIASGTPAGVGAGHKPPIYLQHGDELEFGIAGLGTQCHLVRRADEDSRRA